jgi:ABC-type sugar transport system ATPase subunit
LNPTVELKSIVKSFSGVRALDGVSFQAFSGEIHGIVGENGAGKSTLMKILSGIWPHESFQGEIVIDGVTQAFLNPKSAEEAGVVIVHQELALFEELSVAENIYIGQLPSRWGFVHKKTLREKASDLLSRLKINLNVDAKVKSLRVGQKQLVEIAKAYAKNPKILIFDEPTSALSETEVESLLQLIESLRERNITLLYISHKFHELKRLCDRITVLRDGRSIQSFVKSEWNENKIIEAMVGRKIESLYPKKRPFNLERETLLRLNQWTLTDLKSGRPVLQNIDLDLKRGEILGIAGLMGSGRTELLHSLFGDHENYKLAGDLLFEGKPLRPRRTRDAIRSGFALVTEDRKLKGLILQRSVRENMSLAILKNISRWLKILPEPEVDLCQYYRKLLRLKADNLNSAVSTLSGGNQQKVILARWLATKPKILFLDEPTRGVDVVAKAEIYHWMRDLVDQGLTLILVSSEMPELVSMSDRVAILKEGRLAGTLSGDEINQTKIMERISLA